jgi:hypothetical protein
VREDKSDSVDTSSKPTRCLLLCKTIVVTCTFAAALAIVCPEMYERIPTPKFEPIDGIEYGDISTRPQKPRCLFKDLGMPISQFDTYT